MENVIYHFNPFHDELGRFRSMGRVSVIKPKVAGSLVRSNVIDADFSEKVIKNSGRKKMSFVGSKTKMSGKKKALIALGVIGGIAAIAGGIHAYKKHKEKKKQGAKKMNNNVAHSIVLIERVDKNDPNSLCHFGIKGQKWGIRRYQNPDGSLTKEGQKEYMKDSKIRGRNKGAIAGMVAGGAVGAGLVAKTYLKIAKKGKTAGKLVSSGKKASPVRDGMKIMSTMIGLGFLGMQVGKLIGKHKGKKDLAEYGQKYITQKIPPKKKVVKKSSSTKNKTTTTKKK